jgi:hypothetical protein
VGGLFLLFLFSVLRVEPKASPMIRSPLPLEPGPQCFCFCVVLDKLSITLLGLKSRGPPASASQVAGIAGMHHHAQLL